MGFSARDAVRIVCALGLLATVCWFVVEFPLLRLSLSIGFLAYALCLWRWPWLWLVVVPAALPVFDLAPWSGRFFFDEFDALVLLTIAVLWIRPRGPVAPLSWNVCAVLVLLSASYALSTLVRLWPPVPITADSFADYTSPYNALRIAKGFVWALLLLTELRRALARYPN